jgi:hypothetical protein
MSQISLSGKGGMGLEEGNTSSRESMQEKNQKHVSVKVRHIPAAFLENNKLLNYIRQYDITVSMSLQHQASRRLFCRGLFCIFVYDDRNS